MTLRFYGEMPEVGVEGVKGALAQLGSVGWKGPVMAEAGPALDRLGPGVLCLPVAGLDDVARRVAALTSAFGQPVGDRPFRGHITIGRAKRGATPAPPAPVPFSASWAVSEVTLVASTLHPGGARYQVIGRYRLDG